jgi:hypothetical protein
VSQNPLCWLAGQHSLFLNSLIVLYTFKLLINVEVLPKNMIFPGVCPINKMPSSSTWLELSARWLFSIASIHRTDTIDEFVIG